MPVQKSQAGQAKREYSQLLRLNERLQAQLTRMRDDLRAPGTEDLVREIRNRTGSAPSEEMSRVVSAIEEAIRALQLAESEIHAALLENPAGVTVDGAPNLPAPLARFLAERQQFPGFTYEVVQDEVRGWVIQWKEYTHRGTVRGFGQFYERPYAWIED